jgi:hypothetical protein
MQTTNLLDFALKKKKEKERNNFKDNKSTWN